MPRGASITVENSFSRGLITEFTPLNFPEQAVTETDNCVYNEAGRVTRRLGIDYEPGHQLLTYFGDTSPEFATKEYEWFSVANSNDTKIIVQQTGVFINLFRPSVVPAISASFLAQIDLRNIMVTGTTEERVAKAEASFTTGRGYLFVAHPFCNPIYVEYDEDTGTIDVNQIAIEVRDIQGVDDNYPVDFRPTVLTAAHQYNLFNQGWGSVFLGEIVLSRWSTNGLVGDGNQGREDLPGNHDVWWVYKRTALADEGREAGLEIFDSYIADQVSLGNTPAPKGHYIYNAFNIDRTTRTGIAGLPLETSGLARPNSVAFYAGRLWFAGTAANKYSTRVYYSQLIERNDQFGKCYQINDPTSETTFDLIDTDGGTLDLPLIERVTGFMTLKDSLLVFGTNGVYSIRGTDAGPFRATNYVVEFVSNIGVENPKSIVQIDEGLMWWGADAMYTLQPDQIGISFVVQNVSLATIQGLLDDVPFQNRKFIKGSYNRRQKIAQWIYSNDSDLTGYRYDSILELRVLSNSFYTHSIDTTNQVIRGILSVKGEAPDTRIEDGEVVRRFVPAPEVFKYFTQVGVRMTYSQIYREELLDWITAGGGMPYVSSFTTGYRIRGDVLRNFNTTPAVFVADRIPGASLTVTGVWDYGERTSIPQEIYRNVIGTGHTQTSRLKIRGKGRSLQLRFESTDNAPFSLVGWATLDSGGTLP